MKRRFLIPGHPEQHIEADHIYDGKNGMLWFINGSLEEWTWGPAGDASRYKVVAQFCAGVLILPVEEAS